MLWVELFLVGPGRPATLSESRDVNTLDQILLQHVYVRQFHDDDCARLIFVFVNKSVSVTFVKGEMVRSGEK